ncbi:MAG: hypothetical protein ACYS8X_13895 [Planctomycetota bacterium]|jgi:hypothetical protein
MNRRLHITLVGVLTVLSVWVSTSPAWAQQDGAADGDFVVYYQVVAADNTIRDLEHVPATGENIQSVLRVSRFGSALKAYESVSTGAGHRSAGKPTVTRTYLTWNGKAWVDPPSDGPVATAAEQTHSVRSQLQQTNCVLDALRQRLAKLDHAVADLERRLEDPPSRKSEKGLREHLKQVEAARATCLRQIESYTHQARTLQELLAGRGHSPVQGTVTVRQDEQGDQAKLPVTAEATLPHQVQVWKVQRPEGQRRTAGKHQYTVSMAHPVAGSAGAFNYVAYADTDGDGEPDELIARSPLAVAQTAGQWTSWSFETAHENVYVGNAWQRPDVSHYYQPGESAPEVTEGAAGSHRPDTGLEEQAWIGEVYYGLPNARHRRDHRWGVYLTNIHVDMSDTYNVTDQPEPSRPTGIVED